MFGDVVNQIAIRTDTNGDLVFDFYEDALHTEVRLTNNDELLVNGTLIPAPEIKESSETILAALNTESSGTITPRALAMINGLLHLSFPLLPIQTILTITKETLYLGVSAH